MLLAPFQRPATSGQRPAQRSKPPFENEKRQPRTETEPCLMDAGCWLLSPSPHHHSSSPCRTLPLPSPSESSLLPPRHLNRAHDSCASRFVFLRCSAGVRDRRLFLPPLSPPLTPAHLPCPLPPLPRAAPSLPSRLPIYQVPTYLSAYLPKPAEPIQLDPSLPLRPHCPGLRVSSPHLARTHHTQIHTPTHTPTHLHITPASLGLDLDLDLDTRLVHRRPGCPLALSSPRP